MEDFYQDMPQPRTVAVHVAGDPMPFAGVGADRVWVGVRGCCEMFLALCENGTIAKWLGEAGRVGRTVGLCTPLMVPGNRFARVVAAINELAPMFDRVMTGDLGVAAAVAAEPGEGQGGRRAASRVTWCGRVLNVTHAEWLRAIGIDSVRALSPVSTACKDINHTIDLEMPAFGRIPLAVSPVCIYRIMDRDFLCPGDCVAAAGSDADMVVLSNENGAIGTRPCWFESRDFLDLSSNMKPFGRDTCAVVETSGLTPVEVADAVSALRHGLPVPTTRPLFTSEPDVTPLPGGM